jgi:hypothetical protein
MFHPNGILPEGNLLLGDNYSKNIIARKNGYGSLSQFTDSLIIETILPYLDGRDLGMLSTVSKIFYIIIHQIDALWRDLLLIKTKGKKTFCFLKSWRITFISSILTSLTCEKPKKILFSDSTLSSLNMKIKISNFYSQYLFHHWLCSSNDLSFIERSCVGFYKYSDIPREDVSCGSSSFTVKEFITSYEVRNKPVIITNAINHWKVLKKWKYEEYWIASASADTTEKGEKEREEKTIRGRSATASVPIQFTPEEYFNYIKQTKEESPFYLFDTEFVKIGNLGKDYEIPNFFNASYFRDSGLEKEGYYTDLFRVLGKEQRPDHHW